MSTVPTVLPNPDASAPAQYLRTQEIGRQDAARARAPWLIAPGRSLTGPRLDQVSLRHSSFGRDAAAARFATILIELGIGSPADWTQRGREPAKFLRRTLDRFVACHAESDIDSAFELSVSLSTAPHEWCETEVEPDGLQMFIYFEASSCGFVNLGPALAVCENVHPRLPVTFARLFLHGLSRVFRIYDDRDADVHLSILEENYDPEDDREALAALPNREKLLPPCMKQRPLSRRAVTELTARLAPRNQAFRLLKAALELDRISRRVVLPDIPEPVRESFCDCNLPLPILLAIYEQGDAVEACFDDESQSMLELMPEPQPLIPFDGTDPASTKLAFGCLSGALDTLAAAHRVLEQVPGWEPIPREGQRP
jgi:hypothetical protein